LTYGDKFGQLWYFFVSVIQNFLAAIKLIKPIALYIVMKCFY